MIFFLKNNIQVRRKYRRDATIEESVVVHVEKKALPYDRFFFVSFARPSRGGVTSCADASLKNGKIVVAICCCFSDLCPFVQGL